MGLADRAVVAVEESIERLDLRQDMAQLIGFESAEHGEIMDREAIVGETADVA
jgi:hypothetical protein